LGSGVGGGGIVVGSHFDWRTGNTYDVYQDSQTGEMYYTVEYETAWHGVIVNEEG